MVPDQIEHTTVHLIQMYCFVSSDKIIFSIHVNRPGFIMLVQKIIACTQVGHLIFHNINCEMNEMVRWIT